MVTALLCVRVGVYVVHAPGTVPLIDSILSRTAFFVGTSSDPFQFVASYASSGTTRSPVNVCPSRMDSIRSRIAFFVGTSRLPFHDVALYASSGTVRSVPPAAMSAK